MIELASGRSSSIFIAPVRLFDSSLVNSLPTQSLRLLAHDGTFWDRMFANLKATRDAEYVITGDSSSPEPGFNAQRIDHAWNAPIYAMAQRQARHSLGAIAAR